MEETNSGKRHEGVKDIISLSVNRHPFWRSQPQNHHYLLKNGWTHYLDFGRPFGWPKNTPEITEEPRDTVQLTRGVKGPVLLRNLVDDTSDTGFVETYLYDKYGHSVVNHPD